MKNILLMLAAVAALAVNADAVKARGEFYGTAFQNFNRGTALDYRVSADANRFDKAPGKVKWIAVTPYKQDTRCMLLDIETDGGRVVSVMKRVMGHAPEKLDEKGFAALRAEKAMLVARADVDDVNPPVTFYPVGSLENVPQSFPNPYLLNVSPAAYLAGALSAGFELFGVSAKKLVYRVVYETAGGERIEAGTVAEFTSRSNSATIKEIRAAIEKREPKRRGQVSNRDAADFHLSSKVFYEPVAK